MSVAHDIIHPQRLDASPFKLANAPLAAAWLALGLLWVGLIRHLQGEWNINPQYSYGWGVPFLSAYLFWKRWADRPAPKPAHLSSIFIALCLVASFLLLPWRLIQEANSDWRFLSWTGALLVLGFSAMGLWFAGGRPWLRHFLFPLGFALLSVPWPTFLERALVQNLMAAVAVVTVEGLNWVGIAAIQRGNLIELSNGFVGVDEACSGLHSFQGTLMAAFFLGELCRFPWALRSGLIAAGIAFSLLLNFARAFGLALLTARGGTQQLDRWHDSAGLSTLILAFLFLCLIARLFSRRQSPAQSAVPALIPARVPPISWTVGLILWCGIVEGTTEVWYRSRQASLQQQTTWSLRLPSPQEGAVDNPISDLIRFSLRYDSGASIVWSPAQNSQWTLFFFRWEPGPLAPLRAKSHSPDLCLPATGLQFVTEHPIQKVHLPELTLPFRAYEFSHDGKPYFVFLNFWEDRLPPGADPAAELLTIGRTLFNQKARLQAAWAGKRHSGMQLLEIVISGVNSLDEAERSLQLFIRDRVRAS